MPAAASPVPARPRSAARRRAILEAALGAYARHGWEATSIEAVRRASGASVGSLYHHFGGKEGLAAALYVEGLRDYQQGLLAALGRPRSAERLVKGVVRHHVDWVERRPAWARFLLEMRRTESVASAEGAIRSATRAFFEAMEARFAPFTQRGELEPLAPELRAALLIGPAQELGRQWLRAGLPPPTELRRTRERLAESAWRALRREGAPPRRRARAAPAPARRGRRGR